MGLVFTMNPLVQISNSSIMNMNDVNSSHSIFVLGPSSSGEFLEKNNGGSFYFFFFFFLWVACSMDFQIMWRWWIKKILRVSLEEFVSYIITIGLVFWWELEHSFDLEDWMIRGEHWKWWDYPWSWKYISSFLSLVSFSISWLFLENYNKAWRSITRRKESSCWRWIFTMCKIDDEKKPLG